MTHHSSSTDLAPRFRIPQNWQWGFFTDAEGQRLRFGMVVPETGSPDGIVVALQGLSEYSEKYFEIAQDMLARNLGFYILDWQGQGKSDRHLPDRQKRHITTFEDDIRDLRHFITEHVKPAAVSPEATPVPLIMLAHSMGGHIGLRYLHQYPDDFSCAAFSAPMIGIQALSTIPGAIRKGLTGFFNTLMKKCYVFGGRTWDPHVRERPVTNIFSDDPERSAIHNAWCYIDPDLQVGNITFGWLHEANLSCHRLQKRDVLRNIGTHCLFAIAEKEALVDNKAIKRAAKLMPSVHLLELQNSKHEIFMERDSIRDRFLYVFDELLSVNNIREQLKPLSEQGTLRKEHIEETTMQPEQTCDSKPVRLSDRILSALDLALTQEDVEVAEALVNALELSMTRNTGGGDFVERRDYPAEMEDALSRLDALKNK